MEEVEHIEDPLQNADRTCSVGIRRRVKTRRHLHHENWEFLISKRMSMLLPSENVAMQNPISRGRVLTISVGTMGPL